MVIIMRGPSGSGKSSIIEKATKERAVLDIHLSREPDVVSADHYFIDQDGLYVFDREKLSDAHAYCLREFLMLARDPWRVIIVDNTNTTVGEVAPYARAGSALGHDVVIVEIDADVEKAHARNAHGVPLATVKRQSKNIDASRPMMRSFGTLRVVPMGE